MSGTELKSYRDDYTIRQGRIRLYRRSKQGTKYESDNWYAAYKIPGEKTLKRSLKTTDQAAAELLAEDHYFDLLQKSKRGLSLTSKKFRLVANAFIDDFAQNVEIEAPLPHHEKEYKPQLFKNTRNKVEKYLNPFFQDKTLQEITDFDIVKYVVWRKTYWITGEGSKIDKITYFRNGHKITRPKRKAEKRKPSYDTINKELTVIRKIYEFARLGKLIDGREIPIIKNLSKPKDYSDKKPGLSGKQYKELITETLRRSHNEKNPKHQRHLKLLLLYMVFMSLTGMRVAEGKRLKLSDCEMITNDGEEYLKVFVRAKGKSRELIGLKGSGKTLEELKKLHRKNASIHGWEYHDDLPVFANQYGKSVGSFAKGLNRAFDDVDLLYDEDDIKRTAGAFRKYYITSAILNDKNYLKIAKQCGTSVEIIERYYNEIKTTDTPEDYVFEHVLSEHI